MGNEHIDDSLRVLIKNTVELLRAAEMRVDAETIRDIVLSAPVKGDMELSGMIDEALSKIAFRTGSYDRVYLRLQQYFGVDLCNHRHHQLMIEAVDAICGELMYAND